MHKIEKKSKISVSVCYIFKDVSKQPKLAESVNSILNQTRKPLEIIIVGTERDLVRFKENNFNNKSLIRIIYSNSSKNKARNLSIQSARGQYILRMDYDMRAERHLLEKCSRLSGEFDALIIPERGKGGNFWENCRKLEKELTTYDLDTVSPTFFRKSLFRGQEEPFSEQFGALDEWGFSLNLKSKNAVIGIADTYFITSEDNLSLLKVMKGKFERGRWLKNFYSIDKNEAWRRVNPIKRGFEFYGRSSHYLFKDPIHYVGLLFLKLLDLISFSTGYIVGKLENGNQQLYALTEAEKQGDNYTKQMFFSSKWGRYVNQVEQENVIKLWGLDKDKDVFNEKKILDLCMGPGRWSQLFLKYPFSHVVGVDFSPEMIKAAQKNIHDARFKGVLANAEELPFPREYFDLILSFRSFKYVQNKERALKEISRVIKKGGSFILEIPNKSIVYKFTILVCGLLKLLPLVKYNGLVKYLVNTEFISEDDLERLLQDSFTIKKRIAIFVLPSSPVTDRFYFSSIAIFFENILGKLLPKKFFSRSLIYLLQKND